MRLCLDSQLVGFQGKRSGSHQEGSEQGLGKVPQGRVEDPWNKGESSGCSSGPTKGKATAQTEKPIGRVKPGNAG